jgi:hypothetical protein
MYAAGAAGPREETCQPRPEVSRLRGGLLSAGRTRNPMRPAPYPRSGSPACHDQVPLRLLRISTKRRMTHRRVADVNRAWCAIRRILLDDQAFFAGPRTTCPLPSPRSVRCDSGRMIFSGPSTWRLMGMRPASPPRDDAPDGRHRVSLAWCSDRCRDGRAGHGSRWPGASRMVGSGSAAFAGVGDGPPLRRPPSGVCQCRLGRRRPRDLARQDASGSTLTLRSNWRRSTSTHADSGPPQQGSSTCPDRIQPTEGRAAQQLDGL